MEKHISYLNRTFNDYKNSLLDFTKQYYPDLEDEFNDASVGSWLLDVVANVGDNLSYHIDRVFQETNINSAKEKSSVYALARNNGVKIPGPKASTTEVIFTCEIPVSNNDATQMKSPNFKYAPIIKRGTKVSSGDQIFEVMEDVDFAEQFNKNGISNRTIVPKSDSNNRLIRYVITKSAIVSAGETKIYTKTITRDEIVPFMSFIIPDTNVMNVESIIFKDGTVHNNTPTMNEFFYPNETNYGTDDCGETVMLQRFFEVDYLAQQYKWGDKVNGGAIIVEKRNSDETCDYSIAQGTWVPLRQKFITEYTDKGYLKIIFGSGNVFLEKDTYDSVQIDNKAIISHMVNNDGLGILPKPNTTMYVMYRKGGGASSNVAQDAITNISHLIMLPRGENLTEVNNVRRSLTVTNPVAAISGRDMPSIDEIKYLIKYNNGAQGRCVTLKDYHDRISKLPPRYGCPFRYGVTEENNKVMIYVLGLDSKGKLTSVLPDVLKDNMVNYLSEYKMLNDYIEIKSGRIINLQFEITIFVDKNYNTSNVVTDVINCVKNYMDINRLQMGDDIFVGDIEKEISKVDGVANLSKLNVYNIFGNGYSSDKILQSIKSFSDTCSNGEESDNGSDDNRNCIDLDASNKMLFTENDTMFEIRSPEKDIICRVIQR